MVLWRATVLLFLLLTSLRIVESFNAWTGTHAGQQPPRKPRALSPESCCFERARRTFRVMEDPATATAASSSASASAAGGAGNGEEESPLFVYGTLMNDKVLFALLDRVPSTRKACLSGYHRYRIKDHVFPAIRPREGGSVEGLLMTGLGTREKLIFDLFEDDDYHKVDVQVKVESRDDDMRTATSYVWNADAEDQLYGTWDPLTHFTESGPVPDYVSMVERFAKDIHEEGLLENAEPGGATA
eukprot:g6626.t1